MFLCGHLRPHKNTTYPHLLSRYVKKDYSMRSDLDFINLGDRSYLGTRSTWLGQSTNKPEQIADRLIP